VLGPELAMTLTTSAAGVNDGGAQFEQWHGVIDENDHKGGKVS
jgi:hypothetical protein